MDAKDVLFSGTTQRVLAVLFASPPGDGLGFADILRRTGGGSGAIHRELKRFRAAGLALHKGDRLYAPNSGHPLYPELRAMAEKLAVHPGGKKVDPIMGRTLARKYLWWVDPKTALEDQPRLVAQVMNLGTFEDARYVEAELGEDYLRRVLKEARPGWFEPRSWTYWHYRLGLARSGEVPDLPRRRFD